MGKSVGELVIEGIIEGFFFVIKFMLCMRMWEAL